MKVLNKILLLLLVLIPISLAVTYASPVITPAGGNTSPFFGTYTIGDQIYVGDPETGEGKFITTGYPDYKPTWSMDGKWILFFRIVANRNLDMSWWKTAVCVIRPDGTDFRQLTSGEFSDYNPMWSRDGSNYIYINRYNRSAKIVTIYRTTVDTKPGREVLVSNPKYNEFCHTALKDGRLFVSRFDDNTKFSKYCMAKAPGADGYYQPPFLLLLTPDPGKTGKYETLKFQHKLEALANRINLSPSETKITYEIDFSWGAGYDEHPIVVADIDIKDKVISNETVITSAQPFIWDVYPSWRKDEKGIIFTSSRSGHKVQLHYYDLESKTERRITGKDDLEFKYYCAENCPK